MWPKKRSNDKFVKSAETVLLIVFAALLFVGLITVGLKKQK